MEDDLNFGVVPYRYRNPLGGGGGAIEIAEAMTEPLARTTPSPDASHRVMRFAPLAAADVHAEAFGRHSLMSWLTLAGGTRTVVVDGAVAGVLRVPAAAAAVVWGFVGVVALAVPLLVVAGLPVWVSIPLSPLLGLAGAFSAQAAFRRLQAWYRWRRVDGVVAQVSDVAAWPPGQGRGTAVMAAVTAEADRSGVTLVLRVRRHNLRARRLYERAGFVAINGIDRSKVSMIRTSGRR